MEEADARTSVREEARRRTGYQLDDPYDDPIDESFVRKFLTDKTVDRYLVANEQDLDKAAKQLARTIRWRFREEPRWVTCPLCLTDPTAHSFRPIGFDALGRIVFYACFGTSAARLDDEAHLIHVIRHAEDAQCVLDARADGIGKWVLFLDFHGFQPAQSDVSYAKEALAIMMEHYPERLGMCVLFSVSEFVERAWSWVQSLLMPATVSKIKFIASMDNADEELASFGPEILSWLRAEVAVSRQDSPSRLRWWDKQSDASHDSRGTNSFTSSEDYFGFFGPTKETTITVDKLFDGKLGIRLRTGLVVSGFDVEEAKEFWRINDELLALNGEPIKSESSFGSTLKLAREHLPMSFTIARRA